MNGDFFLGFAGEFSMILWDFMMKNWDLGILDGEDW